MPARSRATKKDEDSMDLEDVTEEDEILAEMEDEDEDYVADEDANDSKVHKWSWAGGI